MGVSYRLTPETGERLLGEFAEAASELHEAGVRFAFGGTPPVAERAACSGFLRARLRRQRTARSSAGLSERAERRAAQPKPIFPKPPSSASTGKRPIPLLRHHFGLPTLEAHAGRASSRSPRHRRWM